MLVSFLGVDSSLVEGDSDVTGFPVGGGLTSTAEGDNEEPVRVALGTGVSAEGDSIEDFLAFVDPPCHFLAKRSQERRQGLRRQQPKLPPIAPTARVSFWLQVMTSPLGTLAFLNDTCVKAHMWHCDSSLLATL